MKCSQQANQETESGLVVARDWKRCETKDSERKKYRKLFNSYDISFGGDKNVLKFDYGDSCTNL